MKKLIAFVLILIGVLGCLSGVINNQNSSTYLDYNDSGLPEEVKS